MSDQSPANIVTGVVDAAKPVVKLVAIVEGAVISAATGDKDAVPELCQVVDKVFDELKK
jgi:hypothetical protein